MTPDALRTRRLALGLTQNALALRLGVSQSTVLRWEAGGVMDSPVLVDLALQRLEMSIAPATSESAQRD